MIYTWSHGLRQAFFLHIEGVLAGVAFSNGTIRGIFIYFTTFIHSVRARLSHIRSQGPSLF